MQRSKLLAVGKPHIALKNGRWTVKQHGRVCPPVDGANNNIVLETKWLDSLPKAFEQCKEAASFWDRE